MCVTDRLLLYALVRGLRPRRCLEIGVRWGGSARIICNALEENHEGHCVGIDPVPEAFRARPRHLHGRYTLVRGYSPAAVPAAVQGLDGPLDFVLIDALHTHQAVLADLRGVLPFLAAGAHVLVHDAFHQGIDEAIRMVLHEQLALVDCGFPTRSPSKHAEEPVCYQGFRLLRVGQVDSRQLITEGQCRLGGPEPVFTPENWNYDDYARRLAASALSGQKAETNVPSVHPT
jgi:hypothetical protein